MWGILWLRRLEDERMKVRGEKGRGEERRGGMIAYVKAL